MDRTGSSSHAVAHDADLNSSPGLTQPPTPAADGASAPTLLPPVAGVLPYATADYLALPAEQRSPALDFLILGKIPGGRLTHSDAAAELPWEFEEALFHCLKSGEQEAVEFLWRESARDPDSSVIQLTIEHPDPTLIDTLEQQCRAHGGLRLKLYLFQADAMVAAAISRWIAQGKVDDLKLHGASMQADALAGITRAIGQVNQSVSFIGVKFDAQADSAMGDALAHSVSLKKLTMYQCAFGASHGLQFVEGMKNNQSILELKLFDVPLGTQGSGGLGAIIAGNATLERLDVTGTGRRPVDMNDMLVGASRNHALRMLEVRNLENETVLEDPSALMLLIHSNRSLRSLKVDAILPSQNDYQRLADALIQNTALLEFSLKRYAKFNAGARKAINDALARNRAKQNSEFLRDAGKVFDPEGTLSNGMSDVGAVISRYVLDNSPSLSVFAETMAFVEVAIRELERQPSATSAASTSGEVAATGMPVTPATSDKDNLPASPTS